MAAFDSKMDEFPWGGQDLLTICEPLIMVKDVGMLLSAGMGCDAGSVLRGEAIFYQCKWLLSTQNLDEFPI